MVLIQLLLGIALVSSEVVKSVSLDGKMTKCSASCACNDASRVVGCKEIDTDQMAVSLILEEGVPEETSRSICMECFYRIKVATTIEKIIQDLPDPEVVEVEIGGPEEVVSLYKSMSKGIVGLKADTYYLVSMRCPQDRLLSKYSLIQLSQHGSKYKFHLDDGKATVPSNLQDVIYLYFSKANGSYMVNDIADVSIPLDFGYSAPSDYSKVLYWVFICVCTINLFFAIFKGVRLVRILLKKNE